MPILTSLDSSNRIRGMVNNKVPLPLVNELPAAGLRFMVVEDHEFQRSILATMLKRLGAKHIHEAINGRIALKISQEPASFFDIIITDIDMPDMDRLAFIRRLSEAGIPSSLIITSSLNRPLLDSVQKMTAAYGIQLLGTIEKPVTPEKLAGLIALHSSLKTKPDRAIVPTTEFTLDEIMAGLRQEEFEPFFQPKIELATGRIKGMEALARWRHPQKGIVEPPSFIAQLEDSGQIVDLIWIILAKAAVSCATWQAAGLDLNVSVNFSSKLLADITVADAVTWLEKKNNLDPRSMIIEITESAAMTNVGKVLENLARLRMKGFGLSIDDYGTANSSMDQLTRISFTELKIDHSFVRNAKHQESSRLILESSLEMARRLKLTSVAEGIETQEDWNLLLQCGCDLAQGHFIAKLLEADAVQDWVREWR